MMPILSRNLPSGIVGVGLTCCDADRSRNPRSVHSPSARGWCMETQEVEVVKPSALAGKVRYTWSAGTACRRGPSWCIVDLIGKHGRVRTIPVPKWVKVALSKNDPGSLN